ncbi:MAG: DNA-3-methyladenine glycosylase [Bacteroidales bacterium]
MIYLEYGDKELDFLKRRSPELGVVIERVGYLKREIIPNLFEALVMSIVSQQISGRAAETILARFVKLIGSITPEMIISTEAEQIRACGISGRKESYIRGAAHAAASGEIDFASLESLEDEKVIEILTSLKGVGVWTAEMLLIFSLRRANILSWGDFAIKRSIMKLYNLESLSREQFEEFRRLYSPYNSIASLYLWEV